MNGDSLSSLARLLSVLDLFFEERLVWSAEEIAESLGLSVPTAYRYVKVLTQSGLLQRAEKSRHTLGPRIIVLDHLLRVADPVLKHAMPLMRELVTKTGFDCVLSALFDQQLLDTHREFALTPIALAYGRGRPRPLFRGAASKVILAGMPPAQLHKIFDERLAEVVAAGLPSDWSAFRRYYSAIRRAGHYFSDGELESQLAAVAVAVHDPGGAVVGALSLVSTSARMALVDHSKLADLLRNATFNIASRLD